MSYPYKWLGIPTIDHGLLISDQNNVRFHSAWDRLHCRQKVGAAGDVKAYGYMMVFGVGEPAIIYGSYAKLLGGCI